MKRIFFALLCAIYVYANPAPTITISCDESYNKTICGDDYLCSASKCFYKNISNIEEAFRFYIKQKIQIQESRNEAEYQNTYLLVLKYMLNIPLPKINESSKHTANIQDYYVDKYESQNRCDFEFKRTNDSLIIEYNACAEEEHSLTFIQKTDCIEVLTTMVAL